ncbi:MAG: hypothetical protein ACLT33_02190 [Lachnospira pectinoschiza]
MDKAYKEWHRVLKKGGVLLNYDANYANMKNWMQRLLMMIRKKNHTDTRE